MTDSGPIARLSRATLALARRPAYVVAAGQAGGQFIRFLSSLVTTRLLAPDVYGAVGILMAAIFILQLVSDIGFHAQVIRMRRTDEAALNTLWTIRVGRNVLLAAVLAGFSGPIASAYGAPELAPAMAACSLLFLYEAAQPFGYFLAERARRLLRLTVVELAGGVLVALVTIAAAFVLRDYWAVVIALHVGAIYTLAANHLLFPKTPLRFTFDKDAAREFWALAKFVFPASLITIALTQIDKFVMARFFPLELVGVFFLAATLAAAARGLVDSYLQRVFYPLIAEAARATPDWSKAAYYSARRRISLALAFGIGGLIGGADLLLRILFDDRYLGAAPFLSLLAIAPLLRLSSFPAELFLVAKGFPRVAVLANGARLAWVGAAGGAAFLAFGPMAAVIAVNLIELAALPVYFFHLARFGALKWGEEALLLAVALAGAGIGFGLSALARALLAAGVLPPF